MGQESYPDILSKDAIVEALCEFNFNSSESAEVVQSKLLSSGFWSEYNFNSLPISNVPPQIRESDPNFRFLAILEGMDADKRVMVKIGGHCLSVHLLEPYQGWEKFKVLIEQALTTLFSKIRGVQVTKIGYRYINFFTESKHEISNINDLSVELKLANNKLDSNFVIQTNALVGQDHIVINKLLTADVVSGPKIPKDLVATLDIDVFTVNGFSTNDVEQIRNWIEKAHALKNKVFFEIIIDHIEAWS
jgi:uncharacterized protein (TIGR04255 family)